MDTKKLETETDNLITKSCDIANLIEIVKDSCDKNNYEPQTYTLSLVLKKQNVLIEELEKINLGFFKNNRKL